jgi:hypothetical protein
VPPKIALPDRVDFRPVGNIGQMDDHDRNGGNDPGPRPSSSIRRSRTISPSFIKSGRSFGRLSADVEAHNGGTPGNPFEGLPQAVVAKSQGLNCFGKLRLAL